VTEELRIKVNEADSVTSIVYPAVAKARAGITLILGHGAGSGQTSGFMVSFANELAARGLDAVTFNFVYSEKGRGAPDPGDKLEACYRAVIDAIGKKLGKNKLAIGGKSMGGRIASQVAAKGVEGVGALVFLGYPLHPPGKPEQLRSKHLPNIGLPMLFVQGTRDAFGTSDELRPILEPIKPRPKLYLIEGGDHSFKVPKSAGITQADVYRLVQDEIAEWLRSVLA
jgi:uncharacterized protein